MKIKIKILKLWKTQTRVCTLINAQLEKIKGNPEYKLKTGLIEVKI